MYIELVGVCVWVYLRWGRVVEDEFWCLLVFKCFVGLGLVWCLV